MKNLPKICFILSLVCIICCSPPRIPHRYHFDNQSNSALTVSLIGSQIDTTLSIGINEQRSFVIPDDLLGRGGDVESPITIYFDEISITNQMSENSTRDYLNNDNWEFVKSGSSDYFTIISEEEF